MSDEVWNDASNKSIALLLNGQTLGVMDNEGKPVTDDSFLILVNASDGGVEYTLPSLTGRKEWRQVMDTESVEDPFCQSDVEDKAIVGGRAIRVYTDGKGPDDSFESRSTRSKDCIVRSRGPASIEREGAERFELGPFL